MAKAFSSKDLEADTKLAARMIKHCWERGASVILKGPPGIGKSDLVAQVAKSIGYDLIDRRLSQFDPPELAGLLYPNPETMKADRFVPGWLPEPDSKTVILLDEIDKAPPAVKNAALQLFRDRALGDWVAGENIRIIAAANRLQDKSFGSALGAALCNRLVHIEIKPDFTVWQDWFLKQLRKGAKLDDRVLAFLSSGNEQYLLDTDPSESHPYATPRSWTILAQLLYDVPAGDPMVYQLAASTVGSNAHRAFFEWDKLYKDINILDILDGKAALPQAVLDESHPDHIVSQYALVAALMVKARSMGFAKMMRYKTSRKYSSTEEQVAVERAGGARTKGESLPRLEKLAEILEVLSRPMKMLFVKGVVIAGPVNIQILTGNKACDRALKDVQESLVYDDED